MRPPQTEEDERANLLIELGTLTGLALRDRQRLPRIIADIVEECGGLDLRGVASARIAEICAEIRAEFPGLGEEAAKTPRHP